MAVRAAYQKAVRDQKLATEISAAKRERDFYMSSVAKAKATAAQKERKLKVSSPHATRGMSKHGICYACVQVLMYDNVYANIKRMHAMADEQVRCISCPTHHVTGVMLPALNRSIMHRSPLVEGNIPN